MDEMACLWAFARLMMGHALADGLQGRLSAMKRRVGPCGAKPLSAWLPWLALHGALHGLATAVALGSVRAGLMEALAHALIDWGKCEGKYGARANAIDQALHVGCKVAWLAMWSWGWL